MEVTEQSKQTYQQEVLQDKDQHQVLVSGYLPDVAIDPVIHQERFSVTRPSLSQPIPYDQLFAQALGVESIEWPILQNFSVVRQGDYTGIFEGESLIGIENGDTTGQCYGLIVDIGTTTVAMTLVDLKTGQQLANQVDLNQQTRYGMDVLSRITYVINEGRAGLRTLQAAIVDSLQQMIDDFKEQTPYPLDRVYELTVAANTTMTHLLLGIDPTQLGQAPYVPVTAEAFRVPAAHLGLQGLNVNAQVLTLPHVSAFIGSDVVAGIYASGMMDPARQKRQRALLIDIGTNGEIVLSDQGRMVACSCAAGPALEGMNISSGMKATTGAVEEVRLTTEGAQLATIGQSAPLGLCGSGILAALREMIQHRLINERGRIIDPASLEDDDYRKQYIKLTPFKKRYIDLSAGIHVSQQDIRQVQLAKGAILSGIQALLWEYQLTAEQIDDVIVAGQFGSHVSEASLIGVGLLPAAFQGKIRYIGNSSHSGAYLSQVSQAARQAMMAIARSVDYIELSVVDDYDRLFSKGSLFSLPSNNVE